MDKRKLNRITWAFVAVTVLAVALMLTGSLHRTSRITLPSSTAAADTPRHPGRRSPTGNAPCGCWQTWTRSPQSNRRRSGSATTNTR